MRLQNLLIIFIIIALPVIMILSVYIEYQIDTVNMKSAYDSILLGATYDTMTTLELNTTNNKYSSASDSFIRDLQASINVFATSFATSLGQTGMTKGNVLTYIPALLVTLYDGYYIYAPITRDDGTIEHQLKPYVYYTKEYVTTGAANDSLVINFSLDNYVVVYLKDNNSYTSKAGYLEVIDRNNGIYVESTAGGELAVDPTTGKYNRNNIARVYYKDIEITSDSMITTRNEQLRKNIYTYEYNSDTDTTIRYDNPNQGHNFQTIEQSTISQSAFDYYIEAAEFTWWYNNVIDAKLGRNNAANGGRSLYVTRDNNPLPDARSDFNNEKINVIENIITDNLMQAMEMYSRKLGGVNAGIKFEMPELTGTDWEKILNNVCVISFMQGFPLGTSTYNNYVIVPSTENKQTINDKSLYYIAYEYRKNPDGSVYRDGNGQLEIINSNGYYHRLGCTHIYDNVHEADCILVRI